jgi:hypothetical protein
MKAAVMCANCSLVKKRRHAIGLSASVERHNQRQCGSATLSDLSLRRAQCRQRQSANPAVAERRQSCGVLPATGLFFPSRRLAIGFRFGRDGFVVGFAPEGVAPRRADPSGCALTVEHTSMSVASIVYGCRPGGQG